MSKLNRISSKLTEDISLPAARAQLTGAGLRREDRGKAQVGVGSTGFESNTCNMHLNGLAVHVKRGIEKAGLVGWIYNTIGVSDGITNGTEGMRYSLPSRELIADSIETMVGAHYYDGHVAVVGCDKNMPGSVMAMARLDRPAIMVYGGTIRSGILGDKKLDIISAFEAYGQYLGKQITEDEMNAIVEQACPGPGACGGMYTANTMASAIETMGMSLPFSSSTPAEDPGKVRECEQVGEAMRVLLEKNLTPRQIMTRKAFDNAITMVIVLGGSTNAVIHLIAMARAAGVELTIDDFKALNEKIPVLGDLRPSGKYSMEDLCRVGGVPAVQKLLLAEGLLDGSCITCTGKTLAENVDAAPGLKEGQKIIAPLAKPVKATGHIRILRGNLAPTGAVAKITGKEGLAFKGPARCFDSEDEAIKGIAAGRVKPGDVVVIRYEGPKGGPGMPEMLRVTAAVMGAGLGKTCAMITDGRFSGGSHGFVIGHVTPEAQDGGPIALLADGDVISIDAVDNRLDLELTDEELAKRRATWTPRPLRVKRGALLKYAKLVKDASSGCVTDE